VVSIIGFIARYEVCYLGKPVHHYKYGILPLWVLGKPKTKSILTSTQDKVGTGSGVYKSCGKV